jgi:hypothetical protein
MKTTLLIVSIVVSSVMYGQKGFSTASLTTTFGSDLGSGFGADISGNGKIAAPLYLGFGVGVTKFSDLNDPYFPFTARITFIPAKNFRNTIPLILVEPGYGLYSSKGRTSSDYNTNGGFTFFGGVGFATASKGKARAQASIGYSALMLKTPTVVIDNFGTPSVVKKNVNHGGITLKAGIMLF